MSELDILKKHWQKADKNLPQYSYEELYKMILKKSSSIVKWILIISLIEFTGWGLLYFLVPESSQSINEDMGLKSPMLISTILTLIMFVVFISIFYRNYSAIKITDSVKQLMERILRTRRTVYFFIIWNIASTATAFIWTGIYYSQNKGKLLQIILAQNPELTMEHSQLTITGFFVGFILTALIMIGIMLLLYRIVYIRLLKRLKYNYKLLKNIDSSI